MAVSVKLLFLFSFFTGSFFAQTDISKLSVDSFYSEYNTRIKKRCYDDLFDIKGTDSLRSCDFCQQKAKLYISLRRKLKHKEDSIENRFKNQLNIDNSYVFYLWHKNEKDFDWEGCTGFLLTNGHKLFISMYATDCFSYKCNEEIIDVDYVIKKERPHQFNIPIDGLSGEHIFYKEDLH